MHNIWTVIRDDSIMKTRLKSQRNQCWLLISVFIFQTFQVLHSSRLENNDKKRLLDIRFAMSFLDQSFFHQYLALRFCGMYEFQLLIGTIYIGSFQGAWAGHFKKNSQTLRKCKNDILVCAFRYYAIDSLSSEVENGDFSKKIYILQSDPQYQESQNQREYVFS